MAIVDSEELENVCVNFIIDKINKLTDLFISNDNKEVVSKDIIAYDGKYVAVLNVIIQLMVKFYLLML